MTHGAVVLRCVVATLAVCALFIGGLPSAFSQPASAPQEDRELDCRNPQDAALCRELERDHGMIRGGRPQPPTDAYRPQAPAQYRIPPPSFNCARAATVIEQAICSDATLAQWDANMGQLYRQALDIQNNSPRFKGEQARWLALRNSNCSRTNLSGIKSCVLEMTKARVGGLAAVVAANGGNPSSSPPTAVPVPYPPSSPATPVRTIPINPLSLPKAAATVEAGNAVSDHEAKDHENALAAGDNGIAAFDEQNAREMQRSALPNIYRPDPQLTQKAATLQRYFNDWQIAQDASRCGLFSLPHDPKQGPYTDTYSQTWYANAHRLFHDGRDFAIAFKHVTRVFRDIYPWLDQSAPTKQACDRLANSKELLYLIKQQQSNAQPAAPVASSATNNEATPSNSRDGVSGVSADIRELINKETALNGKCRGGHGDNPETWKACDERDKIIAQLKSKGWCYGHNGQMEYERTWQQCHPEMTSVAPVTTVLSVEQMERNRAAAEAKEKRAAEDRTREFALLAARNREADPNSITVDMSVTVTSANPPMIKGTTNLPDGTTLFGMVMMTPVKDGLPACSPHCDGYSIKDITVENGCFTSELKRAVRITPGGSYTVYIGTVAAYLEPQNVQSVIGKYGEHLYGPYVVNYDANGKMVPAKYPREWNAASDMLGKYFIYYTQEIHVDGALNGEVYAVGEKRGAIPPCR